MEDFKYMLGTWKVVSTCYGGLVHVKVIYMQIHAVLDQKSLLDVLII